MNQFIGFEYRQHELHVEDIPLSTLATQFGTPCYVYSKSAIRQQWNSLNAAFSKHKFLPCYAVKANSNIAVLQLLAQWGAGFDIVSVGELERVLAAGGDAGKIMFSGVAKRDDEIRAAIHYQISCINVESAFELSRVSAIAAEMKMPARVSLRINPDVNPQTHPYISTGLKESKFGVSSELALQLYASIKDDVWVEPVGVDCHIGSQITDTGPYQEAAIHVFEFVAQLEAMGVKLKHIDLGGGFGITYDQETPPSYDDFAEKILPLFAGTDYELVLEPGRSLVANAGALITRVEYIKDIGVNQFAMVDAAMNDLIRPALYQAWHTLLPLKEDATKKTQQYDVVGPVCESGDFLAKARTLPELAAGDHMAVMSAGAYAMTMASNYNSRQKPCELLIDGDDIHLIRRREELTDLWKHESLLSVES
jgi:diaminopimelate decarboxylase